MRNPQPNFCVDIFNCVCVLVLPLIVNVMYNIKCINSKMCMETSRSATVFTFDIFLSRYVVTFIMQEICPTCLDLIHPFLGLISSSYYDALSTRM
jgi:hypothetical protein